MNPRVSPGLEPRHVAALALAVAVLGLGTSAVTADHGEGAISHCSNPSETVELVSPVLPFQPAALTVEAGTCVEFDNVDSVPHTVRVLADTNADVDEDVDPNLAPGESTTALFESAGTYHGNCELHPSTMHGVIQVT
jgi:plastocyanin